MTFNAQSILLLVGAILMLVSAVAPGTPVDLFKLGWGVVIIAFMF